MNARGSWRGEQSPDLRGRVSHGKGSGLSQPAFLAPLSSSTMGTGEEGDPTRRQDVRPKPNPVNNCTDVYELNSLIKRQRLSEGIFYKAHDKDRRR